QREETLRIAHHVRTEPIERPDIARLEGKGAHRARLDARKRGDARIERRLIDGDDACAQTLQHPAPAAGRSAEIETGLARLGADAEERECFPELQIGTARRCVAILDKARLAIRKRARAAC